MPVHHRNNKRGPLAIILIAVAAGAIVALHYLRPVQDGTSPLAQAAVAAESIAALPDAPIPAPPQDAPTDAPYIHIDKQTMSLTLYGADGNPRAVFGVATGRNPGAKRRAGDNKTPEGSFTVQQIQDASSWTHDFGDGKGVIAGAYGPCFIRLATPGFRGIGIHGTHDPSSIGTRASEGCIRMHNKDVDSLAHMIAPGMAVIITPGESDIRADQQQ